jgi:3-oxoacyl-[acyl-carrier protein] reductase
MEWRDQVAVVTGGARGLGRATAWLLAQREAAICVNYAAHGDAAEALIAEIAAAGGRAIAGLGNRNVPLVLNARSSRAFWRPMGRCLVRERSMGGGAAERAQHDGVARGLATSVTAGRDP